MTPTTRTERSIDPATIEVRLMGPDDVAGADRVMRRAFGVYLGLEHPDETFGAVSYTATRFAISPGRSFVAVSDGEILGSVHATTWGRFGFFGPLTVREDLWDQGVARRLLIPVVEGFDRSDVTLSALFTFAQSAKHVALYQRLGYWPQYLTAIMSREVAGTTSSEQRCFSLRNAMERRDALTQCADLTGRLFAGLDLSLEITSTLEFGFGDTVLIEDVGEVAAFAVCHVGAGEADTGACYVKFAAVRLGPSSEQDFSRLVDEVESFAVARGASRVVAGVDTARRDAYRHLIARGYRTGGQGVRMHRPDDAGYGRADAFVIDDLR